MKGGFMKRLVMLLVIMISLGAALPLWARQQPQDAEAVRAEAVRGFEEILDFWRNGNYGELYKRTLISGKETKESFSKRMANSKLKPSCCWEKMQDVAVSIKTPTSVVISAKLGLDAPGEMEYKTKSFKLNREDGLWRISRGEILALAEAKKKKKSKRH